jgi:glycosyltransferase involved in cell wall biosynthesis
MKKRITILCASYPPETGAAPNRIFHLAQMLKASGNQVTVISSMPNYPSGKIFKAYKNKWLVREQMDGISVLRTWLVPTHSSNVFKRLLSAASYALSLMLLVQKQLKKTQADLIVISSPPLLTGYLGTWMAAKSKAKVLLNVSDLWPQSALELGFVRAGAFYQFLVSLERKMYQRADAFSAQSEEIKQHIIKHQVSKPIFVYRNLQPTHTMAAQDRRLGTRKIVYAGLLGIAQGVFEIIQAIDFAALGTELHLFGQGVQTEQIQEWIRQHPSKGVYYHGIVPAIQIPTLMTEYHAMLVPLKQSIEGAVPSKIFNALANGLPVFYCGSGEAKRIIETHQIGWVSPSGDYVALQSNVQQWLQTSAIGYEAIRLRCLACAMNEFNIEKQNQAFHSFLQSVLA